MKSGPVQGGSGELAVAATFTATSQGTETLLVEYKRTMYHRL